MKTESSAKPAQVLSVEAIKHIAARQDNANTRNGGHCQGGGSW
jgi:hypothetical protein